MKESRIIAGKRVTYIGGNPAVREIRSGKHVWVTYPPKRAESVPVPIIALEEEMKPPPAPKASKKQVLAEISKQLAMRR